MSQRAQQEHRPTRRPVLSAFVRLQGFLAGRHESSYVRTTVRRSMSAQSETVEETASGMKATRWRLYVAIVIAVLVVTVGGVVLWRAGLPEAVDDPVGASPNSHVFPAAYTGPVHVVIRPRPGDIGRDHTVAMKWGGWTLTRELSALDADGATLVFTKSDRGDAFPLFVAVDPFATVRFGLGRLDGGIDVNSGWTEE